MTIMKIIDGLYFTIGMILFNPLTGESKTPDQLNGDDRTTYDACMGAIALLKSQEPHWISVEDGLPQEHDTIFAKFYGTDKWRNGMFLKMSDDVRVVKVFSDGTKRVHHDHTVDGRWESERKGLDVYGHVTHWMPNPELPFCTSRPTDEQREATPWN